MAPTDLRGSFAAYNFLFSGNPRPFLIALTRLSLSFGVRLAQGF